MHISDVHNIETLKKKILPLGHILGSTLPWGSYHQNKMMQNLPGTKKKRTNETNNLIIENKQYKLHKNHPTDRPKLAAETALSAAFVLDS